MPNALTLGDMSPRLRKVVGRESPRVTSTEEPDGGNLLVRIWRGAGVGNLPAYSTSTFCASALEGVGGGSREASPYPNYYIDTCIARTWAQSWWSRVFADTNCRWSDLAPRQQLHTATLDGL